jgi:hypothetical protein
MPVAEYWLPLGMPPKKASEPVDDLFNSIRVVEPPSTNSLRH